MTKKDYIKLAETLKKSSYVLEPGTSIQAFSMFREVCNNLCETLTQDNPAFDRDRFLTACGFTN